jgi:uncharacterized membrane protein
VTSEETRPFELGKSRLEALSDGIFAVAMTLMVTELRVPDLPHDAANVVVVPALIKLMCKHQKSAQTCLAKRLTSGCGEGTSSGLLPKFANYAVSFVSAGVFWVGHHNMYHAIRRTDRTLLWLNIFFFLFVSLLPFSTSVLNAFPMTQVAPLLFGTNLILIGWMMYIQWVYASWQRGMLAEHVNKEYRDAVRSRFLAYPVIATITMLICFWSIEISLSIYVLLLPLYMIPSRLMQRTAVETKIS